MDSTKEKHGLLSKLRLFAVVVLFVLSLLQTIRVILVMPEYYQNVVNGTVPTVWMQDSLRMSNEMVTQRAAARGMDPETYAAYSILFALILTLVSLAVSSIVAWKARGIWFLWFTAWILIFYNNGSVLFQINLGAGAAQTDRIDLWMSLLWPLLWLFYYLFPNGKAVPRILLWPIVFFMVPHFLLQAMAIVVQIPVFTRFFPPNFVQSALTVAPVIFINMPLAFIAQVFRYRKVSNRVERAQTRWVLAALGIIVTTTILGLPFTSMDSASDSGFWTDINNLIGMVLPVSIGISVLRYRLWDVDLIIRRTLQYGLLSILLGLVYFSLVILLGQAFQDATGQQSPLVIVLSTLLIAALFNPLRRRVQQLIDRRFYRQHYDAGNALDRFSQSLRSRVDLLEIEREVARVVYETVQPEQVSLWVREVEKK